MNKDLLLSWLRTILKIVGATLATYSASETVPSWWGFVSGVIIVLAGVGMSQWEHESNSGPWTKLLVALGKSLPPPPVVIFFILAPFAVFAVNSVTGCNTQWLKEEVAKPAVQAGIRQAALLALHAGLGAFADRVKESRPYVEDIQAKLSGAFQLSATVPFASTTPPGDTLAPPGEAADNLRALVAHSGAPPELQPQILAAMRDALAAPPAAGPPGAAPDEAALYKAAVAAAL